MAQSQMEINRHLRNPAGKKDETGGRFNTLVSKMAQMESRMIPIRESAIPAIRMDEGFS